MSEVMNRPWRFSENSVASYSMIIGGIWTAIIQDKRTHSSMYSLNLGQFCNSGKSYNVPHNCLLTSWKGKMKSTKDKYVLELNHTNSCLSVLCCWMLAGQFISSIMIVFKRLNLPSSLTSFFSFRPDTWFIINFLWLQITLLILSIFKRAPVVRK